MTLKRAAFPISHLKVQSFMKSMGYDYSHQSDNGVVYRLSEQNGSGRPSVVTVDGSCYIGADGEACYEREYVIHLLLAIDGQKASEVIAEIGATRHFDG